MGMATFSSAFLSSSTGLVETIVELFVIVIFCLQLRRLGNGLKPKAYSAVITILSLSLIRYWLMSLVWTLNSASVGFVVNSLML
jgi:hypothetical protein